MGEEVKRVAENPGLLVFYTNTDEQDYPIFLTPEKEIYTKKRPDRIVATFHVLSVTKKDGTIEHEFFREAVEAIREITKKEPSTTEFFSIEYEVYRGDYELEIGRATGEAIRLSSCETPFSGYKWDGKKAWAIGYDWKKRISAKHPALTPYIYLKGDSGKKGRAWVKLYIKLPKSTPELDKLFWIALSPETTAPVARNIEAEIRELERMIAEERKKLEELENELKRKREELERVMTLGRVGILLNNISTS